MVTKTTAAPVISYLDIRGPYDLREVALMGFGHRDEHSFDGVMRLAFCVDGDYERQVGVELRQEDERLQLRIHASPDSPQLDDATVATIANQVARVVSVDQDGDAFERMCQADPVLARLRDAAPGFRPALFYSPYEAAVWSVISARRARAQGIRLRTRLAEAYGASFELAGERTWAVPTPSRLATVDEVPGLPSDRIPRLQAIANAAREGSLSVERLTAMTPDEAMKDLQSLPGIGPFYSALIVIRACGNADVLSVQEPMSRAAAVELYGLDSKLSDADFAAFAERWRPFRTWVTVMLRAVGGRMQPG
jgi:DNA-3-methyladenine glycosylase II